MNLGIRKTFTILAPGNSLRMRVAYSLAIARLILVPVIFLAVYYLFKMGWIVDRIVNVDAPAATLAQQASIQMLEARRAERNFLLLHDPGYRDANRAAVLATKQILGQIQSLEPQDSPTAGKAMDGLELYEKNFTAAVVAMGQNRQGDADRVRAVVQAYEKDLDDLLRSSRLKKRAQLVEELRTAAGSFDAAISSTVQQESPALHEVSGDLQNASQQVLTGLSDLEAQNWKRVEWDHRKASKLMRHAEWALGIVSAFTLLFSVWVSFTLPRQVAKPLVSLKEAVDHATAGNGAVDFEIAGRGEVAELAISLRSLIARLHPTT